MNLTQKTKLAHELIASAQRCRAIPTPRTDAAFAKWQEGWDRTEFGPNFARTLERELHESRNAERLARVQLGNERERSRLLLAAMNERDDGYIESRKRMSALESALNAEREKVGALRLACERIVAEWDDDHDTNPIGAVLMYSHASKALTAMEDEQ